ncbi:MAG: PA2169 family four-helix-bundle protein [Planctomycetaceae bacterium]|nr:PA2169 family four-helix-bundle protein [Planctomycetaceae bacterium]
MTSATMSGPTLSESTTEQLQELVQINIDSAKGFEDASHELSNSHLIRLCGDLANERRRQASELTKYVEMTGQVAPKDGSFLAAVHRSWMKTRKLFLSNDEYAILAEAERGEDQIKDAYEQALRETTGSPVNRALQRHFLKVKEAHNRIRSLRDARV